MDIAAGIVMGADGRNVSIPILKLGVQKSADSACKVSRDEPR
jgi:hypothetical protein